MEIKYKLVPTNKIGGDLNKKFKNIILRLDNKLNNNYKEIRKHSNLNLLHKDKTKDDMASHALSNLKTDAIHDSIAKLYYQKLIHKFYLNKFLMTQAKCFKKFNF